MAFSVINIFSYFHFSIREMRRCLLIYLIYLIHFELILDPVFFQETTKIEHCFHVRLLQSVDVGNQNKWPGANTRNISF